VPGVVSISTIEGEKRNVNVADVDFFARGSQKRAHEIGRFPQWFHGITVGLNSGELLDISADPAGEIPEPLIELYNPLSDFAFLSGPVFNEGVTEIAVWARHSSITAVVPGRFSHGACQGFALVDGYEFDFEGGLGSEGIDRVFAGREVDRLDVDMEDGRTIGKAAFAHEHWDDRVLIGNGRVSVSVADRWVPTMLDVTHHRGVQEAAKLAVTAAFGIQTSASQPSLLLLAKSLAGREAQNRGGVQ